MSCHLSGRMFYPNFLYKDRSSIKFSIAVYSPTAASEGCECPCCDIYSSDCTGTTEHGILKLVLNHTKQKRQRETKLTLFRKGQRFSRNHWEVILKMFHDNAVALSTLELSVTSQGLVLIRHLCFHVPNTLMVGWPAWAFGVHFYWFNINYMVPSPLPLIMGAKQCWVSNLNRKKAKGERDKYQMSNCAMTLITKPSFSLWAPLHHHHLHWQCLCGVGH